MTPATASNHIDREESEAFRHVQKLRRFYIHLIQYAFVIPVLWGINLYTNSHNLWAIWPTLGWGSGLLAHAFGVFRPTALLGPQWERREVEKRLGRPL